MCRGNNAISFKGAQSATTQQSSTGLNFIYTDNDSLAPTVAANLDAARTNAFFIVNSVHDLHYRYICRRLFLGLIIDNCLHRYGFTEVRPDLYFRQIRITMMFRFISPRSTSRRTILDWEVLGMIVLRSPSKMRMALIMLISLHLPSTSYLGAP